MLNFCNTNSYIDEIDEYQFEIGKMVYAQNNSYAKAKGDIVYYDVNVKKMFSNGQIYEDHLVATNSFYLVILYGDVPVLLYYSPSYQWKIYNEYFQGWEPMSEKWHEEMSMVSWTRLPF